MPNPKSGAPGPSLLDHTFDPSMEHPGLELKGHATPSAALGPQGGSAPQEDIFGTILGQLKNEGNPLDKIIIGRKHL